MGGAPAKGLVATVLITGSAAAAGAGAGAAVAGRKPAGGPMSGDVKPRGRIGVSTAAGAASGGDDGGVGAGGGRSPPMAGDCWAESMVVAAG